MKKSWSVSFLSGRLLLAFCALLALGEGAAAQSTIFRHPQPGEIYRDFSRTMMDYGDWRVTDPNTQRPAAMANLPNATLSINIGDMQNAVRAEAIIDIWGGHAGTTGKAIRFNGNSWLPIPDIQTAPTNGACYETQYNVTVDVPLSHLFAGTNYFQGSNAGQVCWSFDWGQHGMNGIIIRVYYSSSKPHPTGSITSHSSGQSFSEYPTFTASASGPAAIRQVDYLAYYEGIDQDGDGVYRDYHHYYHRDRSETQMVIKGHVGSSSSAPYGVTWNTELVPDQPAGSVKVLARITDVNGYTYVTNEVTGLSLARSGSSVRLYKSRDVPERFSVRMTHEDAWCYIDIPSGDPLSNATSATIVISTWNGNDAKSSPGATFFTNLNSWSTPIHGEDHFWSLDAMAVPTSVLRNGTNTIHQFCNDELTGTWINWPGPMLIVRYGGSVPPPPPGGATKLAFQSQPSNTQVGSTITPPVTVRIEDANGNLVSDTRNVTVALGSNPSGGSLSGTKTVAAVGGVATFGSLSIDNAGNGYTLVASASGLTGATSNSFNVTTTTPPPPPPPPTGNLVSNGGFELGTTGWNHYSNGGAGNDFAVITDAPVAEGSRKARVNVGPTVGSNNQLYHKDLVLEAGAQYRLTFQAYASKSTTMRVRVIEQNDDYTIYGFNWQAIALSTGWQTFSVDFTGQDFAGSVNDAMVQFFFVDAAPSTSIFIDNVVIGSSTAPPGGATKLAFQTQPSNTQAGATITPAVTVRIEDAGGNLVSDTRNVTVALGSNPGGGSLSGTKTVAAVGGVATFGSLSIDNAGNGYTLVASASGLTGATSNSFNITTTTPPPPPSGNLLSNGGFESGTTGWSHYSNGGAGNDFAVVTDVPVAEGSRKARVNVGPTVGSNNQLYHKDVTLEAGTEYTLMFQAYASKSSSIRVRVIEQNDDYTTYGFNWQTIALSTGWQTFTVNFTGQNFAGSVSDAMVQFFFVDAAPSTAIYVDNVILSSGSAPPPPPPPPPPPTGNVVSNGGFEGGTTDWSHYSNGGAGNDFSTITDAPVAEGARKARVNLGATVGTNNQLYHRNVTLVAGTQYRMTFQAYASKATSIQARVIEQDDDYTRYGFSFQTFALGTGWQTFSVDFTAQNFVGTVNDAMVQFYFVGSSPSTALYFDNVVIGPVSTAGKTLVQIAEKSGEAVSGELFSTVPTETGLLQNYPNPFNPSTQITYTLSSPSHVTLEVYNILGERVAVLVDEAHPAGYFSARFDASNLPSGLYLYRLTTDAGVLVRKMMLTK